MNIAILVAPPSAPQIHRPAPPTPRPRPPQAQGLADLIVEAVAENALNPTPRWELTELMAPDDGSVRRPELRRLRAEILQEIDHLVRAGRLARVGRWSVTVPAPTAHHPA